VILAFHPHPRPLSRQRERGEALYEGAAAFDRGHPAGDDKVRAFGALFLPSPAGGRGVGGEGGCDQKIAPVAAMKQRAHIALARSFRRSANASEEAAWRALRKLRAQGFPARRQHQIGRFVVDLAITRARLVIEIDGAIHKLSDVAENDACRQKELERAGWRILRVDTETAMSEDHLIARVQQELGL